MALIKRALLSVSDKEGIVELAKVLQKADVEIISSGGTRKVLEDNNIKVTAIESVTGNPEAFGGRMKTLSFQVSSALLYRRDQDADVAQAKELEIEPIDLVVCNLYPFSEVAKREGTLDELIENIDIGGPTMVRAAAKNYKSVTVLTSPHQYKEFSTQFETGAGDIGLELRQHFSLAAFRHTGSYDAMISEVLGQKVSQEKTFFHGDLKSKNSLETRYGENPHQKGFVVAALNTKKRTRLASAPCLQGKQLSYNNYLDSDASWRCNSDLHKIDPSLNWVTIVKHSNPCGASGAGDQVDALEKAWASDPVSAFGSIITFNNEVNKDAASFITARFVEVVIAPSFSKEAKEIFSKKKNLRLLELEPEVGDFDDLMVRSIDGGFVVQEEDNGHESEIKTIIGEHAGLSNEGLIRFGLKVTKHLKSNAISLVAESDGGYQLLGAGMGNPNRLVSLEQAVAKAKENGFKNLSRAVLFSDAFFPFRDNIDKAKEFDITAIVQPGGSIKDEEVIKACEENGIAMAFTGMRHFRH
jgi:phosphoribosylaminoimidazolecarboxamide formyltransferase/IMP cyclohydrolase